MNLGTIVGAVLACAVAGAMLPQAQVGHASPPAHRSLPTFRSDNYAANSGQLASFLDPAQVGNPNDIFTASLQFRGLVILGPDGRVMPDLARRYTRNRRLTVWIFYLRKGLHFGNGDSVTASDVVFSIERALAPSTRSTTAFLDRLIAGFADYRASRAQHLRGLLAVNPSTVQITLARPSMSFLRAFASPLNDVLDPAVVAGRDAGPDANYLTSHCEADVATSTGPFEFDCRYPIVCPPGFLSCFGTPFYLFVPNPRWRGPKARIRIKMPAVPSMDTAYKDYLDNYLVDTTHVPLRNLRQARHRSDFYRAGTMAIRYTVLNTKVAPFNRRACRLAVAWGLDRAALSAADYSSTNPETTLMPPHLAGSPGGIGRQGPHFNLARARALFRQCGTTARTPFRYVYLYATEDSRTVPDAIITMLKRIGFRVQPKPLTVYYWYIRVTSPLSSTHTTAIADSWAPDYPGPRGYLHPLLQCGSKFNIGGWCNRAFDRLLDRADATANARARKALYRRAEMLALNDGAVVMVGNDTSNILLNPKVHGLVDSPVWGLVPRNLDWSAVSIHQVPRRVTPVPLSGRTPRAGS